MEKWYSEQQFLTQAILILIPFIGYLIEVLVRIFAVIRKASKKNVFGLILFVLFGGFLFLNFIDVFVLYKTDDLMLIE